MAGEDAAIVLAEGEPTRPREPAPKLEVFGWCMFDFANSSYTTLILTFSFPIYFMKVVVPASGVAVNPELLWGTSVAISQGVVLLTAPIVGAIADFSGAKKRFLFITYLGCIGGTIGLSIAGSSGLAAILAIFIVATIFYSSGENLVAAFLPEISPPESMGRISGLAWALGYIGGLGCLAASYPVMGGDIALGNEDRVRLSFLVVALFFLAGGIPTFLFLEERAVKRSLPEGKGYIALGFSRTLETLGRVRRYRQLFRFLAVFLCYTCGINIVVVFASRFAEDVMRMGMGELIVFFCILQLSASLGALAFGLLQDRTGSKTAIQLSLLIWIVVCGGAYLTTSKPLFYVIGNLAGVAMGAAQSGGRALVGLFSPVSRSGEFFGFWGLSWKLSGVIGPPLFGLTASRLGLRGAILVTAAFFIAGMAGMAFIDEEEGRRAALEPRK